MENYKEILSGSNLDKTIDMLLRYKEMGEKVCCNFNGVMLYSDNIDVDSAYIAVTGMNKEEYIKWFDGFFNNKEKRL